MFNYTHKYYEWLPRDQVRKCQNECYQFQDRNTQPRLWRAPISQQLKLEVVSLCGVVHEVFLPFFLWHPAMWQDQPDGLGGRKMQVPMCQPSLEQKSIFEADLPVVNTYCAFLCIIEQSQFEWPKLLSEETKPEDSLWVSTKYAPIPNNDDCNHELSSAP